MLRRLAVICLALVVTEQICEAFVTSGRHFESCQKTFNVDPADLEAMKAGDFSAPSDQAKCFMQCIYEGAEFMANGEFLDQYKEGLSETWRELFHVQRAASLIAPLKECLDVAGSGCELAYEYTKCIYPKLLERGGSFHSLFE